MIDDPNRDLLDDLIATIELAEAEPGADPADIAELYRALEWLDPATTRIAVSTAIRQAQETDEIETPKTGDRSQTKTAERRREARRWIAEREGWFSSGDLAAALGYRISDRGFRTIRQTLLEEGTMVANGRRGIAGRFRSAQLEATAPDTSSSTMRQRTPGGRNYLAEIRDFAQNRGDWFRVAEAADALGVNRTTPELYAAMVELLERGTIVANEHRPRSPKRRYRFVRPEPSPSNGSHGPKEQRQGSAPVPGTGRDRQPTGGSGAKDYREVIAKARARGWRIEAAPGGGKDRLVHARAGVVTLARTPSDVTAAVSLDTTLRRMERAASSR